MTKKVLIVDDDPSMLRLLQMYLTDAGYEVLQAHNGQEALQIVSAEAPPIVITDWAMPEMDGVQLCRKLRELRKQESVQFVYVIIVTAHSEIGRMMEAFEAGTDDFLSKPVHRPELLARLRAGEHIARLEEDLAKRTREIHRLNAEMAMANEKLGVANDQLQCMATTDELTGVLNRREALNRLCGLWHAWERYGLAFSCVMLDIDHFKKFNDTYGHAVGDTVLRECAGVLQTNVRTTDFVCRFGGEEFLVLCSNTGVQGAATCAEHLRAAVAGHVFTHQELQLKVTVSCGVAECDAEMTGPDDVLRHADDTMYQSKQAGRNRVTAAGESIIVSVT